MLLWARILPGPFYVCRADVQELDITRASLASPVTIEYYCRGLDGLAALVDGKRPAAGEKLVAGLLGGDSRDLSETPSLRKVRGGRLPSHLIEDGGSSSLPRRLRGTGERSLDSTRRKPRRFLAVTHRYCRRGRIRKGRMHHPSSFGRRTA